MLQFDEGGFDKRLLLAALSGVMFAGAWVAFADGVVFSSKAGYKSYTFRDWTPGLVGTISFFMINMLTPQSLREDSGMLDEKDVSMNKMWFFFSVLVLFTSLTLAIVFWIDGYSKEDGSKQFPGVSLFIQALCLAGASFLMFISRGKRRDEF